MKNSIRKTKGTFTVYFFKSGIGGTYACVKTEAEAIILRDDYRADGYQSYYHYNF